MDHNAILTATKTLLDTMDGLHVYPEPPGSIEIFPSCIVYLDEGEFEEANFAGDLGETVAVGIELFVERRVSQTTIAATRGWIRPVAELLFGSPPLANSAQRLVTVRWRTGNIQYVSQEPYYGVTFSLILEE